MISNGSQSEQGEQLSQTSLASKITAGSFFVCLTEAFHQVKQQTS